MSPKRIFLITLFVFFSSLTNFAYSDTLSFGSSTYEGDVKKGKAHGEGIFTFSDGSKYEGKWRSGKFKNKIDKKTREIIKLNFDTGKLSTFEIRGKGTVGWFEAEKTSSGTYELTTKGKRDMDKAIKREGSGSDGGGSAGGGCG